MSVNYFVVVYFDREAEGVLKASAGMEAASATSTGRSTTAPRRSLRRLRIDLRSRRFRDANQ